MFTWHWWSKRLFVCEAPHSDRTQVKPEWRKSGVTSEQTKDTTQDTTILDPNENTKISHPDSTLPDVGEHQLRCVSERESYFTGQQKNQMLNDW